MKGKGNRSGDTGTITLKLQENTDPISNRLEIDTSHIVIIDKNDNFDLLEKNNINKFISEGQELNISVNIDNEADNPNIYLGRYYIKNVQFDVNNSMILDCESFLGIMDRVQFVRSDILYSLNQGNLPTLKEQLDRIFATVLEYLGIPQEKWNEYYELDDDFNEILDYGYIPPKTCRDALQQVCFAHNLTVFDNRNTKILIKHNQVDSQTKILNNDIIVSQPSFELLDRISAATAKVHKYSQGEEEKIMDITSTGEYLFFQPIYITSAVIVEGNAPQVSYSVNGIRVFDPSGPFKIELYGKKFKDDPYDFSIHTNINNGKVTTPSDSKSITEYNAERVLQNTTDFFNQYCLKLKIQYINQNEETGKKINILLKNKEISGILIYQSLDVAGGMLADAEILCKNIE